MSVDFQQGSTELYPIRYNFSIATALRTSNPKNVSRVYSGHPYALGCKLGHDHFLLNPFKFNIHDSSQLPILK
jgi:hypothetical protein